MVSKMILILGGLLFLIACNNGQKPEAIEFERKINLTGQSNFRDLGNYENRRHEKIRTGLIYRSGTLSKLTTEDTLVLNELGIKTVINFLTPEEIEKRGADKLPKNVTSIYLPIEGEGNELSDLIIARQTGDFSKIPADFNYNIHKILPETGKASYRELIKILADSNNYPLVFAVNSN